MGTQPNPDHGAANANSARCAPCFGRKRAQKKKPQSQTSCCGIGEFARKHLIWPTMLAKIGRRSDDTENNRAQSTRSVDESPANQSGEQAGLMDTVATPSAGERESRPRSMTFTYAPGSRPLSHYTIRRGVGMGGFGEVYFAVSDAGKEVALKRIQRNLEIELRGVSQCLNLKHTNLVALFDICHDSSEQAWVVMEYVNGPNLRTVLDQSPDGLSEPEVRRWFSAIAAGVRHLHSAGLVHRDIKPGNVFDDMGVIKVGDYGLSKFISATHRGGHTESVGTFHYMAPEIGRGQYGREIDIYALGIVLFEMLTGQVPFDGESCHEIIVKHLTAEPDLSGVAEPYRSAIAACLQKDPAKRPANVTELLNMLGMTAGREPTQTHPVAPIADREAESIPIAKLVSEPVARFDGTATDGTAAAIAPTKQVDEPLARAVRESIGDLNRWWGTLDRSPGAKKLMILCAGVALLLNTHWLLPVLSVLAIIYVPYYIIRQMVLHTKQQPTYAQAHRIATVAGVPKKPATKVQWRDRVRTELRAKRSIHRAAELSTSWIAATFTVLGLALVAGVIGLRTGEVTPFTLAPFAWMAVTVLLGSLCILGMGKLWERDEGEALPRRLVLAGVGAGIGVASFVVGDNLMIDFGTDLGFYSNADELPQALYNSNGTPLPSGMMAHFALLFAAMRWWKPVDPLRRTRLSLWTVAVTVVAAWAVHQVLPVPQPYGMMMAGGIAIAIQMSAPWIDPRSKRMLPQPNTNPQTAPKNGEYQV